jgi:hypothetical protein
LTARGEWKNLVIMAWDREDRLFRRKEAAMEWVLKLEAKGGWGEVETIEVGRLERRVSGLTAEELGLTLAESKRLLGELARLVLQTQMEEYATALGSAGVAWGCDVSAIDEPAKSRRFSGPSQSTRRASAAARAAVRALWMSRGRP